jgi:hypothetical protein
MYYFCAANFVYVLFLFTSVEDGLYNRVAETISAFKNAFNLKYNLRNEKK